jgi:hypothetical protein
MKKNQLLLLLALAIVLGIAGLYFQFARSAAWNDAKTDRRIFQNLPINNIAKIQIHSNSATVTLEKKQNKWGVAERNDYPADFDKIRDLTRTLWQLKAAREMEIGPSQFERLHIANPGQGNDSGVEIDLNGEKETSVASLILGKTMAQGEDATRDGRFVYNPSTKDRVYLVGETFANIDPIVLGSWLDKSFIAPTDIQEIDQSPWSNNQGWKIVRDTPKGDWKLQDAQNGENLDKSFAQTIGNFAPGFVDVRPASVSNDETGLGEPFRIQLKTLDGFKYDFSIGKTGPDKTRFIKFQVAAQINPARAPEPNESPDDKKKKDQEFEKRIAGLRQRLENEKQFEPWVYLVSDWSLEKLLKRRDEVISKPSPPPAASTTPAPEPLTHPSPAPASSTTPSPEPFVHPSPAPTPSSSADAKQ